MQVDPIKLALKAPGIELLKLKYDKVLKFFAFKFISRHHTAASDIESKMSAGMDLGEALAGAAQKVSTAASLVGQYGLGLRV